MPAMSFSCKPDDKIYLEQVLPALLNRTKTQTIRPLFRDVMRIADLCPGTAEQMLGSKYPNRFKKPRFKVGDLVKNYWKQRTSPKGSWFCIECGDHKLSSENFCGNCDDFVKVFPKLLGEVEITEVFKIEMGKKERGIYFIYSEKELAVNSIWNNFLKTHQPNWIKKLSKKDGFKSAEDMFTWFDKRDNLSIPKPYEVRRWRWLDETTEDDKRTHR